MKKVKLEIILKNDNEKIKSISPGIFDQKNNILKYSDGNVNYILDFNNNFLKKSTEECDLDINFLDEKNAFIDIFYKEINQHFKLNILIEELKKSTNMFYLKYIIDSGECIEYTLQIIN